MQTSKASLLNVLIAAALFAAAAIATPAGAQEPNIQQPNTCSTASDCAVGEFCDTTPKCPGNGAKGMCRRKPSVCTDQYLPVTGCNGRVYSNACVAASDGQPNTGPIKRDSTSSLHREQKPGVTPPHA
jgi:hypothetical protein